MRLRGITALVILALTATAAPAMAAENVSVRRLEGANRYETAATIARATFEAGTSVNVTVARGDAFPDALSGVNPAGSQYYGSGPGPILLSSREALPAATAAFLDDYPVFDGVVMGTRDVLSGQVHVQVAAQSVRNARLGGRNRYDTNFLSRAYTYNFEAELPLRVDGLSTAFLVSGAQYADAISVGPVSYRERVPLLLTAPQGLSPATRDSLMYSETIEQVWIVGGPSAVSEQVVRDLEALGIKVHRIAGANRQETAIEVFKFAEQTFGWTLEHVNLARGDDFPDAIAGGPHAGQEKAPILLTINSDDLGDVTREFLRERNATIASIDVFGSDAAISDEVVEAARRAATP